jgi:uncharacterized membrane protein
VAQTPPPIPPSSTPPPPGPQPPSQPSSNRQLMLVLSYLWILALVPLLTEKEDPEVQWHAKHGLVLTVTEIAFFVALNIVSFVLGNIPGLGPIIAALLGCGVTFLIWLAIIAIHIVAIMKALKGDRLVLPVISDYASKF